MGEKGLFGDLFDMNGDGKLDDFERALEFSVVMSDLEKEEEEQYEDFEDNDLEDEYVIFMISKITTMMTTNFNF